ncbi:MAG: transporter [Bacteroidetes bacterium]|jgi:lipopolysaccharide assembly outer membrane protein LptD (OstA)|nr:MAG: transporter [Bacteroidota bacterium]
MKKLLLACILFFSAGVSYGCDICGCSTGSYFIGPFPYFHKYFVGTRYTFRSFQSVIADDPSQYSKDFYQTVELWGGWNIGRRWQVLGFIPYNFNRQNSDDGLSTSSGIGDISLILNYDLLNRQSTDKAGSSINQQLWVGAGVKIPTGKFSPDPNDIIPTASNQAGSGSLDYLLNAMYGVHVKNWGITSNVNYKINRKANGYKFGDRFSGSAFGYRSLTAGNTVFNPNAGLLYESLQSNKLDGEKVPDSGGNALFAAAGLEIGIKRLTIGFNAQLPLAQNFSNGQTTAKVRGMVHLTFSL